MESFSLDAPIRDDAVRFVCISDTHERLKELLPSIPAGDVLVHCGDFTNSGHVDAVREFNEEMGRFILNLTQLKQPIQIATLFAGVLADRFKHRIVIAGNHELGFEDDQNLSLMAPYMREYGTPEGYKMLTNCNYLCDSFTEVVIFHPATHL